MNDSKNIRTRLKFMSVMFILIVSILFILLIRTVSAVDATGSEYIIGQLSNVATTSVINGTEYSGSADSVLNAITNDAQGLDTGAVIGITGNAVLTPDKDPIIKSYDVYPSPANQSTMVRIFVSAVYTDQILVNIIRPDDEVDEIDMSSNSVYYYPDTGTLGRYTVMFSAIGNTVVNAEDYFDIVEMEEPYVPPEEDPDEDSDEGRGRGGGSGDVWIQNPIYINIIKSCDEISGIIVEMANDTSVVEDVFVTLKFLGNDSVLYNATTDYQGSAAFNLSNGNYTISAVDKSYSRVSRNYELYCEDIIKDDSIKNDSIVNTSGENDSSMDSISGQSIVSDNGSRDASVQNPESINVQQVSGRDSMMIFTGAFLMFLTFAFLTLIFSVLLFLIMSRKDTEVYIGPDKNRTAPVFVVLNDKPGREMTVRKMLPVEEDTLKIESELKKFSEKNPKKETSKIISSRDIEISDIKSSDVKPSDIKISDVKSSDIRPLDAKYVTYSEKPVMPSLKDRIAPGRKHIFNMLSPSMKKDNPDTAVRDEDIQKTLDTVYDEKTYDKRIVDNMNSYDKIIRAKVEPKSEPKSISKLSRKPLFNLYLANVAKEHDFVLCDGRHIRGLNGLISQLEGMDDDIFRYHVTDSKNDFAAWIYDTIGYKELAEAIGPVKSKEKMLETIKLWVDSLKYR